MALQTIRIGSAVDIFQYDDGDFSSGIEVSAPIKSGAPVDPTDVLRLEDLTALVHGLVDNIIMFENNVIGFENNVVFT